MKGVKYLYDSKGEPEVVLIDLKKNPQVWEEFQDVMMARQRRKEPRVPLVEVEKFLRNKRKLP